MGFSIWTDRNVCLGWDDTLEWFEVLGITPVPVLFDGIFDERVIRALWSQGDWEIMEGYVTRLAGEITYAEFRALVAKFVRQGHIQTAKHWMHGQRIERNLLAA